MAEITHEDVQEINNIENDNFRDILPENGTTITEASAYWNKQFLKGEAVEGLEVKKPEIRVVHTINELLENKTHPETGVPFKRKVVELPDGTRIEGVFPEFDSVFDAKIPEELYLKSDKQQFKECNRQRSEAMEKVPVLRKLFSDEQIEQIRDGITDGTAPDGYVWHHDAETGKLQLVDVESHAITRHTGGRSIWGGGRQFR